MSHLALFLLGPPRIERNNQPLEIVRRRAMALLAYLAVTGESHSRESLATFLWPEHDQQGARADLRRTLSVLNKTLDGEWLNIERDVVGINRQADFWLDVTYFQRCLSECQTHGHPPNEACQACLPPLTEAVKLYHDDFMAGFTLPDSPNFDEWQFFQTEQLRSKLILALEHLVHCHINRGETEAALAYAQRWSGLDLLNESAHRQLMQLYAQTGQRAAALRQYHKCVETLSEQLEVSPQPETTILYEHIQAGEFDRAEVVETWPAALPGPQPPPLPAYRPKTEEPHQNLPVQLTPFIGRRAELAEIAQRLADPDCHLLTLIGPGGIGKTRLALEAAARAFSGDIFTDGVYFVSLAPLSRANSLVSAIGHALKLSFYGPESFVEDTKTQLLNYLRERELLLVMDNFEHLLSGAELFVDILQTAPGVKILVTSQERLNLQAEWVLEIQGMRVPQEDATGQLEEYSAVRLFLQNARRIQADFSLTAEDKPYVIRICRLVGGMPLGLELASAWVRQLSCREIVQEIEHNLDFLATSLRDVPERHRSLRAVFAHSWTLLSDEERRVYRQLSVFRGGFRRAAAEQVAGASLPLLSALTDKSFLHKNAVGRYEMHEILRQYAAEKLHAVPEEEEDTRDRACHYYVSFLRPKTEALKGHRQKETLAEIGEEIENLQISWRWAISRGKIAAVEQLVESLYHFYEMRGWVPEGADLFGRAVESLTAQARPEATTGETGDMVLGKVIARQGALCLRLGLSDIAQQQLQKSLQIFQRLEEPIEIAFALNALGTVARLQGDYQQTQKFWQESLRIYREIGDPWGIAWSLNFLGHLAGELGHHLQARQLLEESLSIHQQLGNQRGMAGALNSLGYTIFLLGEYEEARLLLEKSLAIRREIGYRRGIAVSLHYLGRVAGALEENQAATKYLYEALKTVMDIRAIPLALDILVSLATVLANEEGETEQVIKLLRFPLHHSSSSQETKNKARRLLAEVESALAPSTASTVQILAEADPQEFEEMVTNLLVTQAG